MRREAGVSDDAPGIEVQLLRYIGYQTALGAWLQTNTKKSPQPKPIKLPGDDDTSRAKLRRKGGRRYDEVMRDRMERRAAELARLASTVKGN